MQKLRSGCLTCWLLQMSGPFAALPLLTQVRAQVTPWHPSFVSSQVRIWLLKGLLLVTTNKWLCAYHIPQPETPNYPWYMQMSLNPQQMYLKYASLIAQANDVNVRKEVTKCGQQPKRIWQFTRECTVINNLLNILSLPKSHYSRSCCCCLTWLILVLVDCRPHS